jgi:glutamine amidotransferase
MCRLAAYTGPDIRLDHFLLKPTHGLMEQSWAPREMENALLNADGYGFGWFPVDPPPAVYINPNPIWTDVNLAALSRSLASRQWLAVVRSATIKMPVNHANTMPYADDNFVYTHNGFIENFAETLRPVIRKHLRPEIEHKIHGNTDSEYLFALFRQVMAEHPAQAIEQSLWQMLELLRDWLGDTRALLNIVLGDGQRLYAMREAINNACPSLYYISGHPDYPQGQLVASEPLDEQDWQPVPEHSLLVLEAGQDIKLTQR